MGNLHRLKPNARLDTLQVTPLQFMLYGVIATALHVSEDLFESDDREAGPWTPMRLHNGMPVPEKRYVIVLSLELVLDMHILDHKGVITPAPLRDDATHQEPGADVEVSPQNPPGES